MRLRFWPLLAVVAWIVGVQPAWAAPSAEELTIDVIVSPSGTLEVNASLAVDGVDEVTWRLPLSRNIDNAQYYRYEITTGATHHTDGDTLAAVVPVSDSTAEFSYTVVGASSAQEGSAGALSLVQWPVLTGLDLSVERVTVTVDGPATVQHLDCTAGPAGAVGECAAITGGTFEVPQPTFQDGPREPREEVVIAIGYPVNEVAPNARVEERWSLDRAFELTWSTALAALSAALLGAAALYLLHRRTGRDLAAEGEAAAIAMFVPTGEGQSVFRVTSGVRPGHVGTVADERVDPIDITATLIDLASRGHLRIVELPVEPHGVRDWRLERAAGDDELAPFEDALLDGIVSEGEPALVSQLSGKVACCVSAVQDALYDEVVRRGWFESRPDQTRSSWRVRGYAVFAAAAVAAALLVAFTNLGLLALTVLALGAAAVWVADRMPRRTAAGAALLRGLETLSGTLLTHPTDHMPRGRELPEISRVLGYAVVLGGKERWLDAMVAADVDESPDPDALAWYHAPPTWHLRDLPASLTQLIVTVQGELTGR